MYQTPKHGVVANVVPAVDFQNLQAQLEDTQESLAAAFARIEIFRMREKLLVAEIAKLRSGNSPCTDHTAGATGTVADIGASGNTPAGEQQQSKQPSNGPSEQQHKQQPHQQQHQQQQFPVPCYITEVEDHLPVMLISSGGRKAPGSIVVTPDFVDFVEIRARVKRHEFVGFSSAPAVPGHARRSQTSSASSASWKQFLPSCLSPEPGSPRGRSGRVAASDGGISSSAPSAAADSSSGGGAPAVQLAVVDAARSPGATTGGSHSPSSASWLHSPVAGSLSPRAGSRHTNSPAAAWYPEQQQQQHELLGVGPWVTTGSAGDGSPKGRKTGVWQILWQSGGVQQHLSFEATHETRQVLHKHTAKWLHGNRYSDENDDIATAAAAGAAAAVGTGPPGECEGSLQIAVPKHLTPGTYSPRLSEPSIILGSSSSSSLDGASSSGLVDGLRHIAAALPGRYQSRDWSLLYATARHGISLQTLYRKAAGQAATVLLVRDAGGYVFGAFCTEVWKPSPRFFGTGETFVFQLLPHKVMFPWQVKSAVKNDFFMYAQHEALAVGGLGAFAIWLDAELLQGSSGTCGTFGSPCLASKEEFKVAAVELWSLQ